MERISINPSRLAWACDDRGIALGELHERIGTGAGTIAKAISGEDGLTFRQLRSLAKFFNRGVLFFVEPGPVIESTVRSPQFRTLANQKPDLSPELRALVERAEKHRDIYLGLREDLDVEDRGAFDPPDTSRKTPKQAAAVAREWLDLGETNDVQSYREAIERRGILVFMAVGLFGEWRVPPDSPVVGFCIYDPRCPVILIKKQQAESRQSFTLMHELGHVLLHKDSLIDEGDYFHSSRTRERDANEFAGHLLVPDALLQQSMTDHRQTFPCLTTGCDHGAPSGELVVK